MVRVKDNWDNQCVLMWCHMCWPNKILGELCWWLLIYIPCWMVTWVDRVKLHDKYVAYCWFILFSKLSHELTEYNVWTLCWEFVVDKWVFPELSYELTGWYHVRYVDEWGIIDSYFVMNVNEIDGIRYTERWVTRVRGEYPDE